MEKIIEAVKNPLGLVTLIVLLIAHTFLTPRVLKDKKLCFPALVGGWVLLLIVVVGALYLMITQRKQQDWYANGTVTDPTSQPINDAAVSIDGRETHTDQGNFTVRFSGTLWPDQAKILIIHDGFEPKDMPLKDQNLNDVEVELTPIHSQSRFALILDDTDSAKNLEVTHRVDPSNKNISKDKFEAEWCDPYSRQANAASVIHQREIARNGVFVAVQDNTGWPTDPNWWTTSKYNLPQIPAEWVKMHGTRWYVCELKTD